jgi:hypothetical protein
MTADVIMLGEYYYPNLVGGAEIQAMRRAEGLAKMGLSVKVISFDGNGRKKEESINGIKVIRYDVITHNFPPCRPTCARSYARRSPSPAWPRRPTST